MDPVDEFARLKAEIKVLEDRAQLLREGFLRPGARRRSNQYEVVVKQQTRKLFLRDKLPAEVLNNPAYWGETVAEVVTVRALEGGGVAGSGPRRAEAGGVPARTVRRESDDFDLIERF